MEVLLLLGRLAIFTGLGAQRPWRGDSRGKARNRVDFGRCSKRIRNQALQHDSSQGNPGDKNLKNSPTKPLVGTDEPSSTADVNFLFPGLLASRIGTYESIYSVLLSPEKVVEAAHLNELPVKKMVTGIKTADLLLKGIKAVHGVMILLEAQGGNLSALGSPDGIVLGLKAVKVVIKGVKMSQKVLGVNGLGFGGRFKSMLNGFKASWGAMDVVRGSKAIWSDVSSGRIAVVNLVLKGYEASRGALSTVEALSSLKVGFVSALGKGVTGVKSALSGIGVMIKAWMVSKELYVLLIKGLGLSHGAREVLRIISERQDEVKVPLRTLKPAEKKIKSVRFSRKQVDGLWWTDGVTQDACVMSSSLILLCLSVYRSRWCYRECPEATLFSVQGLQTD